MIITPETIFAINDCKCFLVVVMNEHGEELTDVIKIDTSKNEYHKLIRDKSGLPIFDNRTQKYETEVLSCNQFFFTVATPCRGGNPDARSCDPLCGGAAKE